MSNRSIALTDSLYEYLLDGLIARIAALAALREETAALPTRSMQIAPEQGQFMALLLRLMGARRCLEVGVFTGYSSLAVALALPDDGRIVACDVSEEWTAIARRYWRGGGRRPQDRPAARAGRADPRWLARGGQAGASTWPSSTPTRQVTSPTTSARCRCCARAGSSGGQHAVGRAGGGPGSAPTRTRSHSGTSTRSCTATSASTEPGAHRRRPDAGAQTRKRHDGPIADRRARVPGKAERAVVSPIDRRRQYL